MLLVFRVEYQGSGVGARLRLAPLGLCLIANKRTVACLQHLKLLLWEVKLAQHPGRLFCACLIWILSKAQQAVKAGIVLLNVFCLVLVSKDLL